MILANQENPKNI